jgi:tetratricopeptide (TPR) repeat protein
VIGLGYLCSDEEQHQKKAIELFNESLNLRLEMFGENSEEVAEAYHNLGIVYSRMNEHQKAVECYSKALSIKEKVF